MLSNIASGIRTLFASGPSMSNGYSESEFWQRKMLTHFKRIDINGDGFVSRDDFKSLVRQLSTNAQLGEQRSYQMQRLVIQLWEDFWCCGEDKGFDYLLPPEEFIELMLNLLRLSDCKKLLEEPLALLFGVIDLDGNGVITLKEWIVYYETIGLSESDARQSFSTCFDQKSEVNKTDFILCGQHYFSGTDERHSSRHLWGPLL